MNTNFEVTIAIYPESTSLTREINHIKSAVLYSDKINLISPLAYTLMQLTNKRHSINEHNAAELLKLVIPYCTHADRNIASQANEALERLKILKTKEYRSLPMKYKLELRTALIKFANDITTATVDLIGEKESNELNVLVKNKIIHVDEFEYSLSDENIAYDFYSKLSRSIQSSYPLFDEKSIELISLAVKEGIVNFNDSAKLRMKNTALAEDLILKLPSFEEATIDELIDIKKELNNPLVRFRAKLLDYSNTIRNLPWNSEFVEECRLLFDREIVPSIIEIDEYSKSNSFIKNLGLDLLTDGTALKTLGGVCVGMAASGLIQSFTEVASLENSVLLTGGGYVAEKIFKRYKVYKEKKNELEKNDLYFYYATGKRLEKA